MKGDQFKGAGSPVRQTWPDSERSKWSKAKAKQPLFHDNATAKRRAPPIDG